MPGTELLSQMDKRINFHDDIQTMEVDFSNFKFENSEIVNHFYDRLEKRIEETGEDKWFFLVNLGGMKINSDAWYAYSRRGRALNKTFSMGSVRFDPSDETRRQIERAANTEAFDPNLFTCRSDAITRIKSLKSVRRKKRVEVPSLSQSEIEARITFDMHENIMNVDFSNVKFMHSTDVDNFYDHIEQELENRKAKWFFLVNLNGCEIMPEAWIRYSTRGKRANIAYSKGTVRYAAGSETEADIRLRAESQGFDPNIRNTREEAIVRLEAIKGTQTD
jgi:hypothetical protein